jgi:hypothetical protein
MTAGDSFGVVGAMEYFAPAKLYLKECYSLADISLILKNPCQVVNTR